MKNVPTYDFANVKPSTNTMKTCKLFENNQKCLIWFFNFGIRSQCWMRLFWGFLNTMCTVQVKITCEKANFTQMDEVTHQLSKQNFQIKYFYIRQSEFPILYNDFFMDLDINHLSFFDSSKETQCLKITQNVSF